MNKNSVVLLLSANLLTGSALAGAMGSVMQQPDWAWVAAISAGPVWTDGGSTQTFFLNPGTKRTYTADEATDALFDGEFFLGVQKGLWRSLQGQLGLAVAATSEITLSGHIWDEADPLFDNFTYDYKIQHTHVAAKAKLLADMGYWLTPWVSGSVGVGFNHARAFNNMPLIFAAEPTPNFTSHTETTFTYTVGAGVQKALTPD